MAPEHTVEETVYASVFWK